MAKMYMQCLDKEGHPVYSEIEPGFNVESYLRFLALDLIDCGATGFAETGTLWGNTCNWISRRCDIPIFTSEIHETCLKAAKENCLDGIEIYKMSSEKFIPSVVDRIGDLPLFYLDAHPGSGYWPLHDELWLIGQYYHRAFILIHDVKIPNNPNFGWGSVDGVILDIDYIRTGLNTNCAYRLFIPNYSRLPRKQGYVLLFQNMEPCGLCVTSDIYVEWEL